MKLPLPRPFLSLAILICGLTLAAPAASADDPLIRIHGATSAAKIIKAKQADLEAQTKTKFELVANNSGRGLEDLATGKADIALIAGSLEAVAKSVNDTKPDTVKVETLKSVKAAEYPILILANPSNTTAKLTLAQVADLLTGKITNWKDLAGPDLPVVLVLPPPTDGARTFIQGEILQGAKFVATARVLQNTPDQSKVVAQIPGAFALCSAIHKTDAVKSIDTDKPILLPIFLITVGTPNDQLKTVLDAVQKVMDVK